jgi:hypothetical protein
MNNDHVIFWLWGLTFVLSLISIATLWGRLIIVVPIAAIALIAALPTMRRRLNRNTR